MLSAFSVEHCPPSRWNTVRHQHGIVSAIAWNTHVAIAATALLFVLGLLALMPINVQRGRAAALQPV